MGIRIYFSPSEIWQVPKAVELISNQFAYRGWRGSFIGRLTWGRWPVITRDRSRPGSTSTARNGHICSSFLTTWGHLESSTSHFVFRYMKSPMKWPFKLLYGIVRLQTNFYSIRRVFVLFPENVACSSFLTLRFMVRTSLMSLYQRCAALTGNHFVSRYSFDKKLVQIYLQCWINLLFGLFPH